MRRMIWRVQRIINVPKRGHWGRTSIRPRASDYANRMETQSFCEDALSRAEEISGLKDVCRMAKDRTFCRF